MWGRKLMPRESAHAKGLRYLTEHRLTVYAVNDAEVKATCRGSGARYQLGLDRGGNWWCSCPCHTTACSHLAALKAVTVHQRPNEP